jgi:hypothetical protein
VRHVQFVRTKGIVFVVEKPAEIMSNSDLEETSSNLLRGLCRLQIFHSGDPDMIMSYRIHVPHSI